MVVEVVVVPMRLLEFNLEKREDLEEDLEKQVVEEQGILHQDLLSLKEIVEDQHLQDLVVEVVEQQRSVLLEFQAELEELEVPVHQMLF
jgi:hypothetical protein